MNDDDHLELDRLRKQKKRAERNDNLREVAKLCNVIGELLAKNGELQDAIKEHETELALSEALDDRMGAGIACRKIGECYSELGDFDKALCQQNRYLDLANACNNTVEEQRAWATIGRTYLLQSEAAKSDLATSSASRLAEKAFIHSLEVCERLKSGVDTKEYMQMKARLLLNLGLIYDSRGETRQSADYIKQAIDKTQKFHLYDDLYRCQFSLACMYQHHANLSQAVRQMEEAQKSAQKLKDKYLESEAHSQKALFYIQLGDYASARRSLKLANKLGSATAVDREQVKRYYSAAMKMEDAEDDLSTLSPDDVTERAPLYEKLGDCASGLGHYRLAIEFYLKLLRCAEQENRLPNDMIPVYVSLAQTYADDKQYDHAIEFYRKEVDCRQEDHEQVCRTLLNIAEAEELSGLGYSDLSKTYLKAFEHARLAKHRYLQAHVLRSLITVQDTMEQFNHKKQTEARLEKMTAKYGVQPEDDPEGSEVAETHDVDEDINISDLSDSDGDEDTPQTGNQAQGTRGVGRRFTAISAKRNEKGETPLHRACIEGNLRKVKQLVEQGHPLNARDFCGWLPLHEASNHDYPEIVEYLVEHGACINDRGGEHCGGVTPLNDAANCGNLAVMRVLIEHGANVLAKDDEGLTALDCLQSWRERAQDTIQGEEEQACITMETLLREKMGLRRQVPQSQSSTSRKCRSADDPIGSSSATSRGTPRKDELPDILPTSRRKDKQRHLSRNNNSSMLGSDSDSDTDVYPSHRITAEIDNTQQSATESYKRVIASVGASAVKLSSQLPNQRPANNSFVQLHNSTNQRPALFQEGEDVGDDWLVEDMRPLSTKRKQPEVDRILHTSTSRDSSSNKRQRCSSDSPSIEAIHEETQSDNGGIVDYDNSRILIDDFDSDNDLDSNKSDCDSVCERPGNQGRTGNSTIQEASNRLSDNRTGGRKRPHQLKLTSIGVTRNVIAKYPPVTETDNHGPSLNDMVVSPGDETVRSAVNPAGHGGNFMSSSSVAAMRVKVRVKDKLLLIPVATSDMRRSISWLAQETSQRYYNLYGVKPLLQLSTKDGAVLSPDDLISLVLSTGEEVVAIVESWDLPPLEDRYTQACMSAKTVTYRNIQTLMRECGNTGKLLLSNLSLRPVQFQPVFRALQCQYNLKELHLQGNKLNDVGLENLSRILETLPNLSTLDLSVNHVTAAGLKHLTGGIENSAHETTGQHCIPLQNLTSLDLSHNPLMDGCVQTLITLLRLLPACDKLSIAACELSQNLFQHHRMALAEILKGSVLTRLNVSYNHLGPTGVELLLKCLEPTKITSLKLRSTVLLCTANHISKHLLSFVSQPGCVLEDLDVSDCHFTLDDSQQLASLSSHGKSLRHLILSNNPRLENTVVTEILNVSNTFSSCLEDLDVTGCGLSSPIASDFLDILNDKLCGSYPLISLTFTCRKLDKVDVESLQQIWTERWKDEAVCQFQGDLVKLTVKNITEKSWTKIC